MECSSDQQEAPGQVLVAGAPCANQLEKAMQRIDIEPSATSASGGGARMPMQALGAATSRTSSGCGRRFGRLLPAILAIGLAVPSMTWAAEAHEGKSDEEIARELANPNNSLASLQFKNQYRWFKGDLPGADDEGGYTGLFQPTFPFPLAVTESGGKPNVYLRPAIPLLIDQPVPTLENKGIEYNDVTAIGDIGFDLAYGITEANGLLWAVGMVGTMPSATDDDVSGEQWRFGPEFLIAKMHKWGLFGIFPNHAWDVKYTGDGQSYDYSTTTIQTFFKYLPGNAWAVGTTPIASYDWVNDQWTLPLQFVASKTMRMGSTPVKLEFEINYYVQQPDEFGPHWMLGINITPVVNNFINSWIRGT